MTPSMTSQIETLKEVGAILAQNLTDAKFKQEFDIKMEQATSTKEIHLLYKQILAKQALRKKIKDHPLLVNMPMSYHKCSLEFILTQVPELEKIFTSGFVQIQSTGEGGGVPGAGKGGKGGGKKGSGGWVWQIVKGLVGQDGVCKNAKSKTEQIVNNTLYSMIQLDGAQYLIYGKCQSGKSKVIQCVALCHILFNQVSSLVVLDNSTDGANQLKDRCSHFIADHQKLTEEQGFTGISIQYLYVGSCSAQELEDALSGKTCKMIISIANDTQLTKINSALNNIEESRFVICIDEADANMCGNDEAAFRKKLLSIVDKAKRSYAVTATTFDLLFTQEKIESSNTIVIQPNPGVYKGLRQIELFCLDEDFDATTANNTRPFLENDPSLEPFLEFYTNKTPYGDSFSTSSTHSKHSDIHPIICLIKTTHLNSCQDKLASLIRDSKTLGKVWSTVVYNGKGITISHPGVKSMEISGKIGVEKSDGFFHFSSLAIKHALQYFYDLRITGGRVSNIAVISGDMADRGISFVSTNYMWHLTHMYYVPPKNSSIASIVQAVGRLNGNFDDNVPLRLTAPRKTIDNLVRGIEIQEEAIQRATKMTGMNLRDSINSLTFNVGKMPTGKLGRGNSKFAKETADKPDTGQSVEEYDKILREIKAPEFVVKAKKAIVIEIQKGVELGMPQVEFDRLTTKMFPKWSKDDTKIARFMKNLDPKKEYTYSEINTEAIKMSIRLSELTKYTRNDAKGYGMILQCEKTKYKLQPSLIEAFNECF